MSELPEKSPHEKPVLENTPSISSRTAPTRHWFRYAVYAMALLGALLVVFAISLIVIGRMRPKHVSIDETEIIDSVMSRAYGKYSDEHKGWLFVGRGNRTYLVRVIQQAKPEDGPNGDELYFVASGTPMDGMPGALYGVFHVQAGDKSDAEKLVEISSPYRYEGDQPVTPEKVHFEALSENVWAWVIKVQYGLDPKMSSVQINNVVLAPHENSIALLATFKASLETDPGIDCGDANNQYQTWLKQSNELNTVSTTPIANEQTSEYEDNEGDQDPVRCDKVRWTYRTDPVAGTIPVPLRITAKGMKDGAMLEEKTWKVVFDNKHFIYNVPGELAK
ncbi:hypothetical protein [Collimonas silvisoli]|uniref:hypothetical protein n=1 Tax=Collimonas silvisoli TaxID=2825884 RepID=UPI001E5991C5|nr:hypothetical protein [Collimonas silvisoli]